MHELKNRRRLCALKELPDGAVVEFEAVVRGELRPCFAIRVPESSSADEPFAAYVNICAHRNQPVVVDRQPFDDERLLECRAHGARYVPATGECVDGPCVGARLVPVALDVQDGELYAVDDDPVDDSMYELE